MGHDQGAEGGCSGGRGRNGIPVGMVREMSGQIARRLEPLTYRQRLKVIRLLEEAIEDCS
jgi:hypothetical protein